MRIGIDARMIDNTGIGRYLRNLLFHLARIDTRNEYIVFTNPASVPIVAQQNFRMVFLKHSLPIYSLREQYRIPLEMSRWKLDLMHYPNFNVPLLRLCPYVVTIHDLIYYLYPDQCPSRLAHSYACFMLRYATKHARLIITDSEHSKLDLIKYFQLPAEKIRVIFPAADKKCHFASNTNISRSKIMRKHGIVQPYILYVGKHHAYKNIPTLLHAYMHHCEVFEHFQLVIAGKQDVRQQVLYETAAQLDSGNRIIFTDFVSEDDLFALYKGARLFVFPSRYEGFGLPPLEAMACGVPVITSNAASLPEVVGDAGVQVEPLDHHKLADAIKKVLTESALWNTMRQKGLEQAQKFSWETAAQQVSQIYHNVAISQ